MTVIGISEIGDTERTRTHLEVHLLQLLTPLDEERRAYIEVELRERVCALRLRT